MLGLYLEPKTRTKKQIKRINKKFWEQPIAYFPLIRHGPQRKRRRQQFFVAMEHLYGAVV
jgi:hypothetical protein